MNLSLRVCANLLAAALTSCQVASVPEGLPTEAERGSYGRMVVVETTNTDHAYAAGISGDAVVDPLAASLFAGSFVTLGLASNHGCGNLDGGAAFLLMLPVFLVVVPIAMLGAAGTASATNPTPAEQAEVRRIRAALEAGYRGAGLRSGLRQSFLRAAWDECPQLYVVRTSDAAVLRRVKVVYENPHRVRGVRQWAEGDGRAVSTELGNAAALVGQRLAEDLLLHYRLGPSGG